MSLFCMNNPLTFFASFALAGVLIGALSLMTHPTASVVSTLTTPNESAPLEVTTSPFEGEPLIARAAYVFDGATEKVLFQKNADAQLPLASLAKVMNALTALAVAPRYALVPLTPESLEAEGDSGLRDQERWPLAELLSFSLAVSSNDGAFAAAAAAGSFLSTPTDTGTTSGTIDAFTEAMNRSAHSLGLTASYFLNPTGLDESRELAGAYGSARDVSRLMLQALHARPELFGATTARSTFFADTGGQGHTAENTNTITDEIPLLRASKTGFTDLAGGNLSVVFDAGVGKPIVVTVLGSTEEGRFADVQTLVSATLRFLQQDNPL